MYLHRRSLHMRYTVFVAITGFGLAVLLASSMFRTRVYYGEWRFNYFVPSWVMPYDFGLIRRGLSGELLTVTSALSGLPQLEALWVVNHLLVAVMYALILWVIWIYRPPASVLLLLMSPVALLFIPNQVVNFIHQDKFFLILLLLVAIASRNTAVLRYWKLIVLSVLAAMIVLIHEQFVFYSPLVAILIAVRANALKQSYHAPTLFVIPGVMIATGLFLFLFATPYIERYSELCRYFVSHGLNSEMECQSSLLTYPDGLRNVTNTTVERIQRDGMLYGYPFALVLGLAPLLWLSRSQRPITGLIDRYGILLIASAMIGFAILFMVAVDWGRWIHILIMSLIVIWIAAREDKLESVSIRLPFTRQYALLWIAIILYIATWRMPLCCSSGIKVGKAAALFAQ